MRQLHLMFLRKLFKKDYAADCRIYTPENPDSKFANIVSTVDVFMAAHAVGWFVKGLIFRNNLIVLDFIFEF